MNEDEKVPLEASDEDGDLEIERELSDEIEHTEVPDYLAEEVGVLEQGQYVIGVGGCGNNLIDVILLRKNSEHLRGDIPKERWNEILAGQAMINSHLAELANSYYFTEIKSQEAGIAADQYAFHQHGAGFNREMAEDMLLDYLDSDLPWDDLWGDDLQLSRLERARSIWLLHSAIGGTGSGAIPVFVQAMRDSLGNQFKTPIISFPVLNDSLNHNEQADCNTLVGLSRLSEEAEALIPMGNNQLSTLPNSDLFDIGYNDGNMAYIEENRAIITFLELVGSCLASEHDFGDFIDITDIYMPIKQYYGSVEEAPAPILAPAMKQSTKGHPGDHLERAISDLFEEGKLIEFDPSTAWGVSLIFCGPPDQVDNIIDKTRNPQLTDIVSKCMNSEIGRPMRQFVQTYHIGLSGLDNTWLIAFVANPEIPEINRAYDVAEQHKTSDTAIGDGVEKNWPLIEKLVKVLKSEPSDLIE